VVYHSARSCWYPKRADGLWMMKAVVRPRWSACWVGEAGFVEISIGRVCDLEQEVELLLLGSMVPLAPFCIQESADRKSSGVDPRRDLEM
jgi:hypothetical protein